MTEAATRQRVHFIDSESVPGSQYRVTLGAGAKPSCDCPQGKLGRVCKHIEKALDKERREFEGEEPAATGEETSQVASQPLPFDEQPAPVAESRLDAVLKANEAERARGPFRDELPVRTEYDNRREEPDEAAVEKALENAMKASTADSGNVEQAIAAVYSVVDFVQKEKAGGLGYSFAGEAAIIRVVRPAMVKFGLTLRVIAIDDMHRETYESKSGTIMQSTVARYTGRFTHAPSGTYADVVAYGEGNDSGDKSANKAATGAYKYIIRQTFMLETGDDPDKHNSRDQERQNRRNGPPPPPPPPPPPAQPLPAWTEELWTRLGDAGLKRGDLEPVIQRDLKDPNIRFTQQNFYPLVETWLGAAETHTLPVLISRAADVKNT